jgi:hypothetical protein
MWGTGSEREIPTPESIPPKTAKTLKSQTRFPCRPGCDTYTMKVDDLNSDVQINGAFAEVEFLNF